MTARPTNAARLFALTAIVLGVACSSSSDDDGSPVDASWRNPTLDAAGTDAADAAPTPDAAPALDAHDDATADVAQDAAPDAVRDTTDSDAPDARLDAPSDAEEDAGASPWQPAWGPTPNDDGVTWSFALRAPAATAVELWLYDAPTGAAPVAVHPLESDGDGAWRASVAVGTARYYGYRLWGPNWPRVETWEPGREDGFLADVNADGNRFNPNKLVLDPYAVEMSHDPGTPDWQDWRIYRSGPDHRATDSGPWAPKGVLVAPERPAFSNRPLRALRDDVVYEVHVRGLTANDPTVPEALRGTYAGAALRAPYLASLGVTAIEFLPLHETQNDTNDLEDGTNGDNYWGYASLSYFAPDRRYAADRSPGGPTREVQAMVDAFHDVGIKVFVDVVYNHTGEGGSWGDGGENANILSWRGVDNARWYQTVNSVGYRNDNGVGPNLRFTERLVRDGVLDSLRYWHEVLGVDGFRFDLASVLGNACDEDCFRFEAEGLLTEIATMARDENGVGVDLIAEPWGTSAGTYQLGSYPAGWHEWNDRFRIAVRRGQNHPDSVDPAELAMRIHGSSDRFRDDGRGPDAGVSYLISHDGFTLADLYACADKNNGQAWPWGPSDGGSNSNDSSDTGGDADRQRQAARTGLTIAAMSAGVPMITGGDEFLRSQRCNNNPYNVDSIAMWLDWSALDEAALHHTFVQRLFAFRHEQPALRPASWTEGTDRDGDGRLDIAWLGADGAPLSGDAWGDTTPGVLAWMLDGNETSPTGAQAIYVAWNRSDALIDVALPSPPVGTPWRRVVDTAAWMEPDANAHAPEDRPAMTGAIYGVHGGAALVLVAP